MNNDNVLPLLKELFRNRDMDAAVEKLYPLIDKRRLQMILNGTEPFAKNDVLLITSVAMERTQSGSYRVEPGAERVLEKIRLALL